jgi:hypothetical protein
VTVHLERWMMVAYAVPVGPGGDRFVSRAGPDALRETVGVRRQYNLWPSGQGIDAWDVDRLIQLSRDLPIHDVPLAAITEVDSDYWFRHGPIVPTVRRLLEHMRLTAEADTSYPIILAANGRVMDGMHRVARAILDGDATIRAVRFVTDPEPDYRNCSPPDLPLDGYH